MTIFWANWGPLIKYERDGLLRIEDLNPEIKTKWRLTRRERLLIGIRFLWSSLYN